MKIPEQQYDSVKATDVDDHKTECKYKYWTEEFSGNRALLDAVRTVESRLGQSFTRSQMVDFYKSEKIPIVTKFIAAMMWGHEARAGSRRDSRGPWKVSKMLADMGTATRVIGNVQVDTPESIARSYNEFKLDRCGPNFFTKHFYFFGKARGIEKYPLIFDDRVAGGILKAQGIGVDVLEVVRPSAQRSAEAYMRYFEFVHREAAKIECQPDQVEYYLFNLQPQPLASTSPEGFPLPGGYRFSEQELHRSFCRVAQISTRDSTQAQGRTCHSAR